MLEEHRGDKSSQVGAIQKAWPEEGNQDAKMQDVNEDVWRIEDGQQEAMTTP